MTALVITDSLKDELTTFLHKHKKADLISTYLFFLEKKFRLHPILYLRDKTIYMGQEELVQKLEKEGKLWRETEIKIQTGPQGVNANTKKIYICPFSGKVFGDNTHPNPQDAIYDWVSKCPENTERVGGLRVKRFFTSEDPEIIQTYIVKRKDPIAKIVFSSMSTGKLFNSKQAILDDLIETQLKPLSLTEVTNQNKFQMDDALLAFIQTHLEESKLSSFVEAMSAHEEFSSYVDQWLEEEKDD